MKIRKEFKIGIFAIIVILVSWWGMSWLGGQNLFTSYNTYTVYYEDVSKDLQVSSRVYIRGVIVGNVQEIELQNDKVKVVIAVEEQYADMIPEDSKAVIKEGMMGGATIHIEQGTSTTMAADGSKLEGYMDGGIMGMFAEKGGAIVDQVTVLMDNLNGTVTKLDETVSQVNGILDDNREGIQQIVTNLETLSSDINAIVNNSKGDIKTLTRDLSAFTTMLKENTDSIESMLKNLDHLSGDLANSDIINNIDATVASLYATIENLNGIIATIESGEGAVGKLLNDDEVYNSIDETINSLNALLIDLKENPKRYINISVFGKSDEEIAAKQAKKEAKEAARAAKRAGEQSAE